MSLEGAKDGSNRPVAAFKIAGTVHKIDSKDANTQTTTITDGISLLIVQADVDSHIAIGPTPVASVSLTPITGKVAYYFRCRGGLDKVSVVKEASASDGNLYVTEMQ